MIVLLPSKPGVPLFRFPFLGVKIRNLIRDHREGGRGRVVGKVTGIRRVNVLFFRFPFSIVFPCSDLYLLFLTVDVTEEPESSAIAVEDKPVKLNIRYILLDILQILY